MRLLLDTHIFLWYITADPQLETVYTQAIQDANNDVYLSVVSLWEILIKNQLGKLPLPQAPEMYIPQQRTKHGITALKWMRRVSCV